VKKKELKTRATTESLRAKKKKRRASRPSRRERKVIAEKRKSPLQKVYHTVGPKKRELK